MNEAELDKAISNILTTRPYAALVSADTPRPTMLNMCAYECFVHSRDDKSAELIRRALLELNAEGKIEFDS